MMTLLSMRSPSTHPAGAISADGLHVRFVGVEFHCRRRQQAVRNCGQIIGFASAITHGGDPMKNDPQICQARQRLLRHPRAHLECAQRMEDEGHKIIKLNIGNLAVFGFDSPRKRSSRT
jgi:hypothetical protein